MPAGRPAFEITEAVCKKAESLAAQGLTQYQIAAVLGMGERTFYEKIKQYPQFMQAVEEQKIYGPDKIIVYKKFNKKLVTSAYQDAGHHYSISIPSKDIGDYEQLSVYQDLNAFNDFLYKNHGKMLNEADFLDAKKRDVFCDIVIQLDNQPYDLAVRYSGDFLLYFGSVPSGEIRRLIKAREVWDAFVEGNYKTAEPGLIFWSHMSKYSPSNYVDRPISSTNPCAEVPLEDGGACNLGSINLSRFVTNGFTPAAKLDIKKINEITGTVIRFLDNVVSWNEKLNPLEKQRKATSETRRLGLGIMGTADMLNQLGIAYDSDEGVELVEKVMQEIANSSYQASAQLAKEKGQSSIFDYKKYSQGPFFQEALSATTRAMIKENGLRNIALLAIAPTGSISNIVLSFKNGNKNYLGVSSGLEPIFALFYTRRSESFGNKFFKVFHSTIQAYIDINGLSDKVKEAQTEAELTEYLPGYFFRTAHHISAQQRVDIQGRCQKYVDHSISSTINLAETVEPETISDIYLSAWKKGLKGITIYRDGSRFPILSVESQKTEFQEAKDKTFVLKMGGKEVNVKGDDVISLPSGELTTVFHYFTTQKKQNEFVKVKA